ncbi:hypothetical protein Hanom_Chr09g00854341 [Helianthus anomalus]
MKPRFWVFKFCRKIKKILGVFLLFRSEGLVTVVLLPVKSVILFIHHQIEQVFQGGGD